VNSLYPGIDLYYLLLVVPALLVAAFAQMKVNSAYNRYKSVPTSNNMTGYDAARRILDDKGLKSIPIERVKGRLTDHYDPRTRVIRLSDGVFGSNSVAAVGVAAHEAGHAVQYADGYAPIKLRSALLPVTNIGATISMPLILIGMFAGIPAIAYAGIILFSTVTIFQLVTLPVEFNASRRAVSGLRSSGMLSERELEGSKKVLSAAAMTYVAALMVSFMNLLRLLLVFGGRGGRRR